MNKFNTVIDNLRTALASAEYCEIGGMQNRQVWIYPKELEALIECAEALLSEDSIQMSALKKLEACADE